MKAYRVFVHGQKLIWSKFEIGLTSLTQSLHAEFEIMRHSEFAFFKRSSWHENVCLNDKFSQQIYGKCSYRYKKILGECLFTVIYLNFADLYLLVSCEAAVCLLCDFKSWRIGLNTSVQRWKLRSCLKEMPQNLKFWWPIWFNPPPPAKLKIYLNTDELCKIWWIKN